VITEGGGSDGGGVRRSGTVGLVCWGGSWCELVAELMRGAPDDAGVGALVESGVNDDTVLGVSDNSVSGFDRWILRVVGGRPSDISGGRSNILLERRPELELQESDVFHLNPLAVGSKFVTPVVIRLVNTSDMFAEGIAVETLPSSWSEQGTGEENG
jgi:hypothetical protein